MSMSRWFVGGGGALVPRIIKESRTVLDSVVLWKVVFTFFTHLKLLLATATHNFKWVKKSLM